MQDPTIEKEKKVCHQILRNAMYREEEYYLEEKEFEKNVDGNAERVDENTSYFYLYPFLGQTKLLRKEKKVL